MTLAFARTETDAGFVNYISEDGIHWRPLSEAYCAMPLLTLVTAANNGAIADILSHAQGEVVSPSILHSAASVAGQGGDIWGAGLNYKTHAQDLNSTQPESGPGSYLRPTGCLIANGEVIVLPSQSQRVTAEAELGLLIGRTCKNVSREDWRDVVVAVTAVLDMTAEDAIRENPRYIPWAKGFDTFCSVGPALVPLEHFSDSDIQTLRVTTIRNGEIIATARVSDMRYDLGFLVSHFSAGRTLRPGTVICTGTPGAVAISHGDTVEARVESVGHLIHTVRAAASTKQEGY